MRSAGGDAISETERSPYTVSASVRGIGVAVRCRTCGLRPCVERRPLLDAEAVLLVDDGDGKIAKLDLALDQCMRPDDDLDVARSEKLPHVRVRLGAPSALVSRATRTPRSAQIPSIVKKCCSASTSVGAISAPWRPASTARSRAESATTVLPEPTSPWSSRCIGLGARQVAVDLSDRALLRFGQREGEDRAVPLQELAGRRQGLGDELLAFGGTTGECEMENEKLVEGETLPADLRLLQRTRTVQCHERIGA